MKPHASRYLNQLREATRHIHSSVELQTDSDRLLSSEPTLSHYQQFITAHYLLHTQIAQLSAIFAHQTTENGLLDWPECPRINALKNDLIRMGININILQFQSLPIQTHAFTLGLVYVSEGSCIGNQRVLTALNRHQSFKSWGSDSFLSTCKEGFSDRWKTLLSAIDQLCTHTSMLDGSGYDELELGAIRGFELYMDYWSASQNATSEQTILELS